MNFTKSYCNYLNGRNKTVSCTAILWFSDVTIIVTCMTDSRRGLDLPAGSQLRGQSLLFTDSLTTELNSKLVPLITPWHGPRRKYRSNSSSTVALDSSWEPFCLRRRYLVTAPYMLIKNLLPSSGCCFVVCFAVVT
jgi:hypothetical protein